MKVLSSRLIKFAAMAAVLVSSAASAQMHRCGCTETATRHAESARASVLTKLSTCDQYKSDPAAYNACTAPIYAEAQALYTYVYNQAYGACSRACPV